MKSRIIIPTFDRPALVERMLKSLNECDFPAHADVEVVVVENGKRAGTEEVCKKYPIGNRVRYVFVDAPGRSRALNAAIRESDADFLIFFDDDLRFPKQIIAEYISAAERYGPGHFFGGPLIADVLAPCPPHLVPFLPPSAKDWSLGDSELELSSEMVDLFFGANWAVFKKDLEGVGVFAEELGVSSARLSPLGEETVIQRDLLKAEIRGIYLPKASIYHLVQKECFTLDWVRERKVRHGVTDYLLFVKGKTDSKRLFGIPAWIIRSLLEEYTRLLIAWMTFASIEQRTKSQMRVSYVMGILHGAYQARETALRLCQDQCAQAPAEKVAL